MPSVEPMQIDEGDLGAAPYSVPQIPMKPMPDVESPEEEALLTEEDLKKRAWVKQMRLKFSVRPLKMPETKYICDEEGRLNLEYWVSRHKKEVARKWTDKEKNLLMKGIREYGIGNWPPITERYLELWSSNDLRVKTIRLIGRQNLQLYKGWKGDENMIAKEYTYNKEVGERYNCWKGGVLVTDDDGKVEAALRAKPYACRSL
eukprot:Clim_evm74s88 gene=Clim_evmTU74s88